MYYISVKDHFDAAHNLPHYLGECSNLHGHTWKVSACWSFKEVDKTSGMTCDFKCLKQKLHKCLSRFDHGYINNVVENPTAENLAKHVFEQLIVLLPDFEGKLNSVKVWETEDCCVEYVRS